MYNDPHQSQEHPKQPPPSVIPSQVPPGMLSFEQNLATARAPAPYSPIAPHLHRPYAGPTSESNPVTFVYPPVSIPEMDSISSPVAGVHFGMSSHRAEPSSMPSISDISSIHTLHGMGVATYQGQSQFQQSQNYGVPYYFPPASASSDFSVPSQMQASVSVGYQSQQPIGVSSSYSTQAEQSTPTVESQNWIPLARQAPASNQISPSMARPVTASQPGQWLPPSVPSYQVVPPISNSYSTMSIQSQRAASSTGNNSSQESVPRNLAVVPSSSGRGVAGSDSLLSSGAGPSAHSAVATLPVSHVPSDWSHYPRWPGGPLKDNHAYPQSQPIPVSRTSIPLQNQTPTPLQVPSQSHAILHSQIQAQIQTQSQPTPKSRRAPRQHPVRKRISRACDQCNQLRTRCDGQLPCAHCVEHSLACKYARAVKKRGKVSKRTLALRLAMEAAALVNGRDNCENTSDVERAESEPEPETKLPSEPKPGDDSGPSTQQTKSASVATDGAVRP